MWDKNDWHQFFAIANRPWQRHRPPRPVYPSGAQRVLPAIGFSLSELDDAGINVEAAERLGLARRCRSYRRLRTQCLRAARVRPLRAPTRKTGIIRLVPNDSSVSSQVPESGATVERSASGGLSMRYDAKNPPAVSAASDIAYCSYRRKGCRVWISQSKIPCTAVLLDAGETSGKLPFLSCDADAD